MWTWAWWWGFASASLPVDSVDLAVVSICQLVSERLPVDTM
jgi:hypothetical protein